MENHENCEVIMRKYCFKCPSICHKRGINLTALKDCLEKNHQFLKKEQFPIMFSTPKDTGVTCAEVMEVVNLHNMLEE
jgi:hypothetical protein